MKWDYRNFQSPFHRDSNCNVVLRTARLETSISFSPLFIGIAIVTPVPRRPHRGLVELSVPFSSG